MFSILIPTWNNLSYLKLCIDSIRRHSAHEHQIIVHVNEGTDGTLAWVREQGIAHTWSKGNVGVCLALNDAARLATCDSILFMNDDMFCTPGWDLAFEAALDGIGDQFAYLAARMIEPTDTGNEKVTVANFGMGAEDFDEAGLLGYVASLPAAPDRNGIALQPMLVSRRLWHLVGGYSIEFGPGMSSDDDFLLKLWLVGCRIYRAVDASRIYHFGCSTTRRVRKNKGGHEFLLKWGVSQGEFNQDYIAASARGNAAALPNVPHSGFVSRYKRMRYALRLHPTGDLRAWEPDLPAQIVGCLSEKG